MSTSETERRRYPRGGLVARIEDVTYRVLRRNEDEAGEGEDAIPEFPDRTPFPVVNVTSGLPGGEELGEPF
jgi:hypothetical protein